MKFAKFVKERQNPYIPKEILETKLKAEILGKDCDIIEQYLCIHRFLNLVFRKEDRSLKGRR